MSSGDLEWLQLFLANNAAEEREERAARLNRVRIHDKNVTRRHVQDLERDLGRVALVARSLAELCIRKGVFSAEEFEAQFRESDLADGVSDGRLDPKVVKPGEQKLADLKPIPREPTPAPPKKRRR
jgi:hypothetical protein